MPSDQNITRVIDDLYEGALDPSAWSRGIRTLVDMVSGSAGMVSSFDPTTGRVLRSENHGINAAALAEYDRHWSKKDPRIGAAALLPIGKAMTVCNVMSKRAYLRTEAYNEFLLPNDVPWTLGFWLHKSPDKMVALAIEGTHRRGPFDEHDAERVEPILPHLRRVLEIRDRLENASVRCDALAASFNNLTFGVLILDATGRLLEANASASLLLQGSDGIHRNSEGKISLREPADSALREWLCKGTAPAHNRDGLLHVERSRGGPLSILVTRLPELATSWFGARVPRWMLLIFDPNRRRVAAVELIARDLSITTREAQVAALLVEGCDVNSIATRLSISLHTARTHLKSVFAKTGISSQSELVRRVATGPAGVNLVAPEHSVRRLAKIE